MKRFLALAFALCMALAVNAQDLPYSKYLDYSKQEFRDSQFKYNKKTNSWTLFRVSGLGTTINVLAILVDAYEDIRPSHNDYQITVQMGQDDKASDVRVVFYNDETYHKLLTFIMDNGEKLLETSSGKLIKHQALFNGYNLELNMEQHIVSRTSARTFDPKAVKNVDESYNEYEFIIKTDVAPWSKRIEKQLMKQAKRDAKGKKKRHVEDLM